MPTVDIEVRSVTRKPEDAPVVDVDVTTSDGAVVRRRLRLQEIDTIEKFAAWLIWQDLVPRSHITALEGAYRITFHYETDPEWGDYPVLDSVVAI